MYCIYNSVQCVYPRRILAYYLTMPHIFASCLTSPLGVRNLTESSDPSRPLVLDRCCEGLARVYGAFPVFRRVSRVQEKPSRVLPEGLACQDHVQRVHIRTADVITSHRGSIYADRMPQEPQRVFARYRSDIGYPEGLQQATACRAANKGKALSHALRLGWQCTVEAAAARTVSQSATGATERFLSCRRALSGRLQKAVRSHSDASCRVFR
jgi:hypothetical protein